MIVGYMSPTFIKNPCGFPKPGLHCTSISFLAASFHLVVFAAFYLCFIYAYKQYSKKKEGLGTRLGNVFVQQNQPWSEC